MILLEGEADHSFITNFSFDWGLLPEDLLGGRQSVGIVDGDAAVD